MNEIISLFVREFVGFLVYRLLGFGIPSIYHSGFLVYCLLGFGIPFFVTVNSPNIVWYFTPAKSDECNLYGNSLVKALTFSSEYCFSLSFNILFSLNQHLFYLFFT